MAAASAVGLLLGGISVVLSPPATLPDAAYEAQWGTTAGRAADTAAAAARARAGVGDAPEGGGESGTPDSTAGAGAEVGAGAGAGAGGSGTSEAGAGTGGFGGASDAAQGGCMELPETELAGDVVRWGGDHLKDSAAACCAAFREQRATASETGCNAWVFCAAEGGCGDRKRGECWLKSQPGIAPGLREKWQVFKEGPGTPWTSGLMVWDGNGGSAEAEQAAQTALEEYRASMRDVLRPRDETGPRTFFDVAIGGVPAGRIVFAPYYDVSPLAAENFRALCTGEKGVVPPGHEGAGKPYHFKGSYFYRVIDRFIDQTGAGTESIYGGHFKDDPGGLELRHTRAGLLSMANIGPDTNGSHFSIIVAPTPHLDGHYTIFGEVVEGMEVVFKINALAKGQLQNELQDRELVKIVDAGQLP